MRNTLKVINLFLLLTVLSCGKKSTDPTAKPGNTPKISNNISGMFIQQMFINAESGIAASDTFFVPMCMFFSPPVKPDVAPLDTFVDVGTVTVNTIRLQKFLDPIFYTVTNDSIRSLPMLFNISGSPAFVTTTFTDSGGFFPLCSNLNQLPDTIFKSAGFNFTLSNRANTAVVEVNVGNLTESFTGNTITFSPSQLSGLSSGGSYNIKLSFLSGDVKTLTAASKNYQCTYTTEFLKTGVVVVP